MLRNDILDLLKDLGLHGAHGAYDELLEHGRRIGSTPEKILLELLRAEKTERHTRGIRYYFPDAVTTRGAKHLRELMAMKAAGHRAVLLFMVLHSGIARVRPAAHIDPHYSQLVEQAITAGVEILCYRPHVGVQGMVAQDFIPFESGHLLPEG